MVERGGLENRCALAGTVGSNPTLSANISMEINGIGLAGADNSHALEMIPGATTLPGRADIDLAQ